MQVEAFREVRVRSLLIAGGRKEVDDCWNDRWCGLERLSVGDARDLEERTAGHGVGGGPRSVWRIDQIEFVGHDQRGGRRCQLFR